MVLKRKKKKATFLTLFSVASSSPSLNFIGIPAKAEVTTAGTTDRSASSQSGNVFLDFTWLRCCYVPFSSVELNYGGTRRCQSVRVAVLTQVLDGFSPRFWTWSSHIQGVRWRRSAAFVRICAKNSKSRGKSS